MKKLLSFILLLFVLMSSCKPKGRRLSMRNLPFLAGWGIVTFGGNAT